MKLDRDIPARGGEETPKAVLLHLTEKPAQPIFFIGLSSSALFVVHEVGLAKGWSASDGDAV